MTHDAGRPSRRDLLRRVGRWCGLGAVSAVALRLGLRDRDTRSADAEVCINDSYCRTCGRAGECGLPQALSARRGGGQP